MTRKEKTDNLLIWREKIDFPREININVAVSFSRKKKRKKHAIKEWHNTFKVLRENN